MHADEVARRWSRRHGSQLNQWALMALMSMEPYDHDLVQRCLDEHARSDAHSATDFAMTLVRLQREARRPAA